MEVQLKSARKMFEELGYKKYMYSNGIRYTNEQTEQNIEFENGGFINIYNTCCNKPNDIEVLIVEEIQAINKQIEELGWNNE